RARPTLARTTRAPEVARAMNDPQSTHLTEAERHGAADGTLAPELAVAVGQHLEACDVCATDVARIKTLMTRTREVPTWAADDAGALWPAIRARIEEEKVASLHERPPASGGRRRRFAWLAAGVAAAGLIAAVVVRRNSASTPMPVGFEAGTSLT